MENKNYWKIDDILKTNSQYNIVYGMRGNGKSFAIKHYCAECAKDENRRFILLRRRDNESKTEDVLDYFKDLDVKKIFGKQAKEISVRSGRVYVVYDIIGTNRTEKRHIGYTASIAGYSHTAGRNYNDVENIIFEEFISRELYLPNEPSKLIDFVSTVARERNIRVWMAGNTITRMCPYFTEWELRKIPTQQINTIDIYKIPTDRFEDDGTRIYVRVAVERSENIDSKSKMIFGKKEKMISMGEWESDTKPHLKRRIETYSKIYQCVVQAAGFTFLCYYLYDEESKGSFWYVEPKTTPIKENTRVISDTFNPSPYYTLGFIALSIEEKALFNELIQHNAAYSDNLTGTDFEQAIRLLK